MKILVTGGGGFLGTEICKQLLAKGHEVSAASRSKYPHLIEMGVEAINIDLSSASPDLDGFDAIIHTAAKAGVWGKSSDFYKNNFLATSNIANAAKEAGIKYFIYTSSPSVVFGKDDLENANESLAYPDKFYTDYSKTKAMAEELVLGLNDSSFKTVAIRPHLIWGEGDPHLVPRILEKSKAQKLKIVGEGTNLVDVIHVKNAAHAHVLALEAMVASKDVGGKAYFVGQERPVNLWEFINQILIQAGHEGVEDRVGFGMAYTLGAVLEKVFKLLGINNPEPPMTRFVALQLAKHHYFSHEAARRDLGYSPIISIEEGIATLFDDKKERLKAISELSKANVD
ncbi:MAG: NAD-dependent epimerase/dehydratase family protein [Bacteriovoracaceae bacterium]|nr:NAD-dependent epimerase/dehydratase family protein [Bacteriovoracaceae bacterium]